MQMSSQKDATVRARVPMALAPTRSLDDLSTALFSRGLLLSACATTHSSSSHSHAKRRTISQGRRVCLFCGQGFSKIPAMSFGLSHWQHQPRITPGKTPMLLALLTVQALRSYTTAMQVHGCIRVCMQRHSSCSPGCHIWPCPRRHA
jgi:hypothetical protein